MIYHKSSIYGSWSSLKEHVWCTHCSFWVRSMAFTLWTFRHCKKRPQDCSRWTMLGLNIMILCMCTILRPTMAHHRVHTLGHFSSIRWPRSKTSYMHTRTYTCQWWCLFVLPARIGTKSSTTKLTTIISMLLLWRRTALWSLWWTAYYYDYYYY